jgi:hypothetical protein
MAQERVVTGLEEARECRTTGEAGKPLLDRQDSPRASVFVVREIVMEEVKKTTREYGRSLRVRPSVEMVVEAFSQKIGLARHSIRNIAILLGIKAMINGEKIPKNIKEFEKLRLEVLRMVEEYGKKEGEKERGKQE